MGISRSALFRMTVLKFIKMNRPNNCRHFVVGQNSVVQIVQETTLDCIHVVLQGYKTCRCN